MTRILTALLCMAFMTSAKAATYSVTLKSDNIVMLNSEIDSQTVPQVIEMARAADASLTLKNSKEPLYLIINSPGGSIDDGLELIENLQNLNREVRTLSLFSASMAFQTSQNLSSRYILKNGTMMSHKARGGFQGEFPGQLDSRYNYYLRRITRMDQAVVDRSNGKHTLKSYRDLIENEYWCDGQDCVDQGFADNVVNARCDRSLDGTNTQIRKFSFMGMPIEVELTMSNCPLNTNPLDVNVNVGGKPLFRPRKGGSTTNVDINGIVLNNELLVKLFEKVDLILNDYSDRKTVKKY